MKTASDAELGIAWDRERTRIYAAALGGYAAAKLPSAMLTSPTLGDDLAALSELADAATAALLGPRPS